MKNTIKDFYKEYLSWAKSEKESEVFSKNAGLCMNLADWCDSKEISEEHQSLKNDLKFALHESGLCTTYPFGVEEYFKGKKDNNLHKDPARLKWVEEQLNKQGI